MTLHEEVDLTIHDRNVTIERASKRQHTHNNREIFCRLGILTICDGLEDIDQEKLLDLLRELKKTNPELDV